jgi:hypothetical protein
MYNRELKIRHRVLEKGNGVDYFDVMWIPSNGFGSINNPCDYEKVMETINETYPDSIVIDPEGFNALTLVQFLYDTYPNYDSSVRKVQRGGEFVEKYESYELLLHLKPKVKRELKM